MIYTYTTSNELYHHGIHGQKWGVRRFQNKDGSLTAEGYKHYGLDPNGNKTTRATKSEHTKERTKQYARNAAIKGLIGGGAGAVTGLAMIAGTAAPPLIGVYAAVSLASIASSTATAAAGGAFVGKVIGTLETKKAQKSIQSQRQESDSAMYYQI